MPHCSCGELTEDAGGRCARCAALQTLDLQPLAGRAEIESAYRTLVKVWHPDRFQHDDKLKKTADEKLKAINAAYSMLTSAPAKSRPRPQAQESASAETPSEPQPSRSSAHPKRHFLWLLPRPTTLMGVAVLTVALCAAGFLLKAIDSVLSSDPATGGLYSKLKAEVGERWNAAASSARSEAGQRLHSLIPQKSAPAAAQQPGDNAQSGELEPAPQSPRGHATSAGQIEHVKLLPYITAGLTKAEVIAIQGAPTTATEDKLMYGGTELNFSNDKLDGWKIDPTAAPVRVKLWPDAPVDPSLQYFTVGSRKDEVIAVQGTPTLFSENTFGYGGSEVYFQNNRVVSWKADPASVPLRAVPR